MAIWLMTGLLLLSAIPLIAGGVRLAELAGGAAITPAVVAEWVIRKRGALPGLTPAAVVSPLA